MLGDQQRCNNDALELIRNSDIRLVRVFRGAKTGEWFDEKIKKHGLNNRLIAFKDIDHIFLRFLLQHASVYLGLVDSSWQPAGWTVACEAFASGLPIVLYEGLVSRESNRLGAGKKILCTVPMGDMPTLQKELRPFLDKCSLGKTVEAARKFAGRHLDCEKTGADYVRQVEQLIV